MYTRYFAGACANVGSADRKTDRTARPIQLARKRSVVAMVFFSKGGIKPGAGETETLPEAGDECQHRAPRDASATVGDRKVAFSPPGGERGEEPGDRRLTE